MTEPIHFKSVVIYDGNRNEYSLLDHNQNAEEARHLVETWNPHLLAGFSLIALDQARHHRETDPQRCRACRELVACSANLSPKPKFTRRKES